MNSQTWVCSRCNGTSHEEDTVTMTGSGFSKFLNVQNRKFLAITCSNCQYTELYKGKMKGWENVIDFFGN